MSHRPQPAPNLRPAPAEPCHPEVRRGAGAGSPAAGVGDDPARFTHPASPARSGLTLIEMLVALAVTLVMMAAVVNLFANISGSIRNRRAVIEVSGELRQVRQRLALDLAGATCNGKTWQRPENDAGYVEIIEGPWSDINPSYLLDEEDPPNGDLNYATSLVPGAGDPQVPAPHPSTGINASPVSRVGAVTNGGALGDWDDILALTVRSESDPFRAEVNNQIETSPEAEVIWYAFENPHDDPATPTVDETIVDGVRREPGFRRIYRRVFLIAPWVGPQDPMDIDKFKNVSMRFDSISNRWIPNTLGDLTKRENRATREFPSLFPHPFRRGQLPDDTQFLVLNDALAFDVRIYDSGAPLFEAAGGTIVQPGDPGWTQAHLDWKASPPTPAIPAGLGAYVELGWNGTSVTSPIYAAPSTVTPPLLGFHDRSLPGSDLPFFDTWSTHYESDRINQDNGVSDSSAANPNWRDALDQGTNGFDDDGINGVDDPRERETRPMFDVPLRGVKVSLRIYERDARQIRETSVTNGFTQ